MIEVFNLSVQGESHKNNNKPCQDYSLTYLQDDLAIAVVSDGHGGAAYFRSDVGAQLVAQITLENVKSFVENKAELFVGKPFTQVGVSKSRTSQTTDRLIEVAFQSLFGAIISQWYKLIEQHAKTTPLSEWEKENVPEKYLQLFEKGESYEHVYGCTLMAAVRCEKCWFAFHIGDGKCVAAHKKEDSLEMNEPVLWDDACFLNITTSICGSSAVADFRYSYCGDGSSPITLFLGSDGVDDCFVGQESLNFFYAQLMDDIVAQSSDEFKEELEQLLPAMSKRGSQDDISIAAIFDRDQLSECKKALLDYQVDYKLNRLSSLLKRREELTTQRKALEKEEDSKEKQANLSYNQSDMAVVVKAIETTISAIEKLRARL